MVSLVDFFCFGKEILRSPKKIGALAPSGQALCKAMAREAESLYAKEGIILEFGPGLGGVTQALMDSGIPKERLLLIEYSSEFINKLQKRFSDVRILQANALDFVDVLEGQPLVGIVSSLPLKLFSERECRSLMKAISNTLEPGGRLVQFSYSLKSPLAVEAGDGMSSQVSPWIWRNMPPARVWVYEKS